MPYSALDKLSYDTRLSTINISIGENWLDKRKKPIWVYSSSPLKRGRNNKTKQNAANSF